METVFIAGAARTPIGSLGGALASVPAVQLGAAALRGALERAGVAPDQVEEVYMGNVLTAGEGQAPANQASIYAGIPTRVPCTTVNKVCASGMKAVMLGAQSIRLGDSDVVAAGGMESMSQVPYYLDQARAGYRLGHGQLTDGIIRDGLWDPYRDFHMGSAAELCASRYGISREEQDRYAAESYRRVAEAYDRGCFSQELVPVDTRGRQPVTVDTDEEFRKLDLEKMPRLRSAFEPEGSITAANASKINDGGAALLLVSERKMREWGLQPLARIVSFADASQDPEWFTTTPVLAMRLALQRAGLRPQEVAFAEINEAFSCVPIVNAAEMGWKPEQVNVWGGAVALGHPIGCSGARILVTLLSILRRENARYGVAGICNGGGGASAMVIERA